MKGLISGCLSGVWSGASHCGKKKSGKDRAATKHPKNKDDLIPSERLVIFNDGSAYFGCSTPRGTPHGFGMNMSRAGDFYEGEWVKGLRHGTGRTTSPLGQVFAGTYQEGRRHGEGLSGPRPQGAPIFREVWKEGVLVHREEELINAVVDVEQVCEKLEDKPPKKHKKAHRKDGAAEADRLKGKGGASKACASHLPGSVLDWTNEDVLEWLKKEGLEKFSKKFARAAVTGEALINMDRFALEAIGITRFGHRSRVQDSLKYLRSDCPGVARNSSTHSGNGSDDKSTEQPGSRLSSPCWSFANPVPQVDSKLILPWSHFTGLSEQNRSWSMSSSPSGEEGTAWTFGKRYKTKCQYLGADVAATMLRGGLPKTATPSACSPRQDDLSGVDLDLDSEALGALTSHLAGHDRTQPDQTEGQETREEFVVDEKACQSHKQWVQLVQTLAGVRHPNIAFFLGVTVANDFARQYYVISSLHPPIGCTLDQWLYGRPNGVPGHPGSARSVASICVGLAVALQYLHHKNLVHRHLHPKSVYLEGRSRIKAKVADWMCSALEAPLVRPAARERLEGITPWTAPEIMRNPDVTPKFFMDIYSFGVVMWEILSHRRPYSDLTTAQMVMAVGYAKEELPTPPNLDKPDTITQTRVWIIARDAVHPRPDWRPTASQVVARLGWLKHMPTFYEENLPSFFGCY